ncbi:hypothetical protein D3F03_02365 [Simplicispira hankyongi]|uniref:Uncharacterized protein n=1 Tax=Simplicispira hankyongi TaxID=2315688 RepID=A0A398CC31_9BURK|nr:hypothetical protein D3F03_02365 [Simplicispira hankyongi]
MQPPEAPALRGCPSLRRQAWSRTPQPPLSQRCALREGGRRQRGGAALARRPLVGFAPVLNAVGGSKRHSH